ncbi:MAG: glycosyltransferase family 4 protein [Candidatus Eisenbacteria bacterium]|uniref:Glycosyltransferase family 4 protein n=1 Tax=Eiseniibacteriota bacterium TaxID=2212470 RepID=A0A956SHE5_UNCEI|nr:glycosyltransferase family 4 protein [Candidatus Eisenbacteria bacterium]
MTQDRLRILIVSYRDLKHPEQGGAEVIIHEVYRRMRAKGHEVTFLTCRFPGGSDRDEIDGMPIHRIGNLYDFNFRTSAYIKKEFAGKIDVVVEDLNKLPFYTPRFTDLPVLVNIPHLFGTTVFQQAAFPLATYVFLQEKLIPSVYGNCEFQVLSESTRGDLEKRGIPPKQLHVVKTGIDHDYYRPAERNGTQPGPILLYLGRLKKYKCIEFPIDILPSLAKKHPDVEYWIAGEGDYRDALAARAREKGVSDRVKLLGYVEGKEKKDLLDRTRVLCYTSPKEGWGLSVIEANAVGVPCVASNSPGLCEAVRDGETGYLVPHGDLPALERRIDDFLSDPELWEQFSKRGMEWADEFHWDKMTDQTEALLRLAITRHRKA